MRKIWIAICIILVIAVFFSGCVSQRQKNPPPLTGQNLTSNATNTTKKTEPNITEIVTVNITKVPEVVDRPALNLTFPLSRENIRWRSLPIPVLIGDGCELYRSDILEAMNIWESDTVIRFVLTGNNNCSNCITVTCYQESQAQKTETKDYIYTTVGEGWAFSYRLDGFNIIERGGVDIYETTAACIRPIRYVHEFGHALGMNHTQDERSVLYPYEECSQTITEDMRDTLAQLYSANVTRYIEYLYSIGGFG